MSSERTSASRINPAKLMHSKWTAVSPVSRERHFMVVEMYLDELERVADVDIEAVITGRITRIDWRQLKNRDIWIAGWR